MYTTYFQIQERAKYDPKVPGWINVYTVLHFVLVVFAFDDLSRYNLVIYLVTYLFQNEYFLCGDKKHLIIILTLFVNIANVTFECLSHLCLPFLDSYINR